jgi:hypothetical protein
VQPDLRDSGVALERLLAVDRLRAGLADDLQLATEAGDAPALVAARREVDAAVAAAELVPGGAHLVAPLPSSLAVAVLARVELDGEEDAERDEDQGAEGDHERGGGSGRGQIH